MNKDYYDILGITKQATDTEIKSAYRKLAKEHHPDKTGEDDVEFKKINQAYSTLSDKKKRNEYDNPNQSIFSNFYDMSGMNNRSNVHYEIIIDLSPIDILVYEDFDNIIEVEEKIIKKNYQVRTIKNQQPSFVDKIINFNTAMFSTKKNSNPPMVSQQIVEQNELKYTLRLVFVYKQQGSYFESVTWMGRGMQKGDAILYYTITNIPNHLKFDFNKGIIYHTHSCSFIDYINTDIKVKSIRNKTYNVKLKDLKSFNNIKIVIKEQGLLSSGLYVPTIGNYIYNINVTPPNLSKLSDKEIDKLLKLIEKTN